MYNVTIGRLDEDEWQSFEAMNPGYRCTGETLREEFPDGSAQTLVVFKCKQGHRGTRYGMCRDCGDHYILARWSRYDSIDKKTLKITVDVDDR